MNQPAEHTHHTHRHAPTLRQAEGRRITWISVGANIVLTIMQVIVGWMAHSQSLIADAMHTLSDIIADGFVLYANRKGAEAADAEHPYGHGRYETAASLVLGVLLAVTGGGILVAAAQRLIDINAVPPVGEAALWAAGITLIAKEGLFRYMLAVAERLRSPMLVANAWHARADALSSLVVAAGIGGALMGINFADALAAIVVGVMIIRAGIQFAWEALQELIDTGLDPAEVAAIRATLEATPGVVDLHELRTRRMAHQVLVDAHIQVNPRISVSEGHRVAEQARARVLDSHHEVLDVLVHIDPEADLPLGEGLQRAIPQRDVIVHLLEEALGFTLQANQVGLHYLANGLEAEVYLPAGSAILPDTSQRLEHLLCQQSWLHSAKLCQDLLCSGKRINERTIVVR